LWDNIQRFWRLLLLEKNVTSRLKKKKMCDAIVSSCSSYPDWKRQMNQQGGVVAKCAMKNLGKCASVCGTGKGTERACITCLNQHCPLIGDFAKCVKCLGVKKMSDVTQAEFQRCSHCEGASPFLPVGPPEPIPLEYSFMPVKPVKPMPFIPIVVPQKDDDRWMLWIGGAVVIALVIGGIWVSMK